MNQRVVITEMSFCANDQGENIDQQEPQHQIDDNYLGKHKVHGNSCLQQKDVRSLFRRMGVGVVPEVNVDG